MTRVLIIAYGNPLRSDDGVAWRAAEAMQGKFAPAEVEIACLHQLGPELAETVNSFPRVLFVDALSSPESHVGEIRVEELGGKNEDPVPASHFSHAVSPRVVVRLAETLYGAKPRTFVVTVAGEKFDHGEELSPVVAAALPHLVNLIEALIRSWLAAC